MAFRAAVVLAGSMAAATFAAAPAFADCGSQSSAVLAESSARVSGVATLPFTGFGSGPFVVGVALIGVGAVAWWIGARPARSRSSIWRVFASLCVVALTVVGADAGAAHAASPCEVPATGTVVSAVTISSVPEAAAPVILLASTLSIGVAGWAFARRRVATVRYSRLDP